MQPVFFRYSSALSKPVIKLGPYVNAKTLLTLTLLQAREAAMSFFRPSSTSTVSPSSSGG